MGDRRITMAAPIAAAAIAGRRLTRTPGVERLFGASSTSRRAAGARPSREPGRGGGGQRLKTGSDADAGGHAGLRRGGARLEGESVVAAHAGREQDEQRG